MKMKCAPYVKRIFRMVARKKNISTHIFLFLVLLKSRYRCTSARYLFPDKGKKKVLRACPAANEVFNGGRINIYTRRGVFSPGAESRLHPNTYVTVRNDISSIAVFMKQSYAE